GAVAERTRLGEELATLRAEGAALAATLADERAAAEALAARVAELEGELDGARRQSTAQEDARHQARERLEAAMSRLDAAAPAPAPRPAAPADPDAWREQLTVGLSGAASLPAAVAAALAALGGALGWEAGVGWWPDERGRALRCVEAWAAAGAGLDAFATWAWQASVEPDGPDLRARAVNDGASGEEEAGAAAPAFLGLGRRLVLPVVADGETIGALELFSRDATPPPEGRLEALRPAGAQLGQVAHALDLAARRRRGPVSAL
ncbi:MAG TPA: hypothetical protein VGI54_12155, partial [Solirubrobacteraceae bacterium]